MIGKDNIPGDIYSTVIDEWIKELHTHIDIIMPGSKAIMMESEKSVHMCHQCGFFHQQLLLASHLGMLHCALQCAASHVLCRIFLKVRPTIFVDVRRRSAYVLLRICRPRLCFSPLVLQVQAQLHSPCCTRFVAIL